MIHQRSWLAAARAVRTCRQQLNDLVTVEQPSDGRDSEVPGEGLHNEDCADFGVIAERGQSRSKAVFFKIEG